MDRMGRVLVLYRSATGNTDAMARLVAVGAAGVPETEVRVRSIQQAGAEDLAWCDGIALGSPTNMGMIAWEMKRRRFRPTSTCSRTCAVRPLSDSAPIARR